MDCRLFVDMDGTLAVFTPVQSLSELYEPGYFLNREPHPNVVAAVKHIVRNSPHVRVRILSAYLADSPYALEEKHAWLDRYLPEISSEHRLFVPYGRDKREAVGDATRADFLLDDYTHNLHLWERDGRGIKLMNGINGTQGKWTGARVRYDSCPLALAQSLLEIVGARTNASPTPSHASRAASRR